MCEIGINFKNETSQKIGDEKNEKPKNDNKTGLG